MMTTKDYEVKGGGYEVVDDGVRGSAEGMHGGCEEGIGSNVSRQIARQSLHYDTPSRLGYVTFRVFITVISVHQSAAPQMPQVLSIRFPWSARSAEFAPIHP